MMVCAERTYQEWAAMTPWQRDDFIHRFMKYQQERKEEADKQTQEIRAKMPRAPQGKFH